MTPVEIAYFKHFMFDKDLARSFQHLYRTRRILGSPRGDKDGNPESIEEYLMKTPANDVIMKAFYFAPTNNNAQRIFTTYDYWKDIDDKWQAYMKDNESNFSNDSWPNLRKTFSILRQNWDAPAYWKRENLESTEEVYKRMHIDLPLPDFIWEHGDLPPKKERKDSEQIATNIFNAKNGDILVRVRKSEDYIHRLILLFKELVPYEASDGVELHKAYYYACYDTYEHRIKIPSEQQGNILVTDNPDICYRLAFEEEKNILMEKIESRGYVWSEKAKTLLPKELTNEEINFIVEGVERGSIAKESDLVFADEPKDDPLAGFDFLDDVLPSTYRLKSNEISVNFNKGYKITFNQLDSKVIRESGLKFARLAKNKDGDICLIINRQKGVGLTNLSGRNGNMNATINSADITGKLRLLFSLKSNYSVLLIDKLQVTQEFIIYKINKKQ